MPLDEYDALVQEYFRDYHSASLRATIMNASGNFSRAFSISDFNGEAAEPAPANSNLALRDALKKLSKDKPNGPK